MERLFYHHRDIQKACKQRMHILRTNSNGAKLNVRPYLNRTLKTGSLVV